jgi:pyruvate kinase
MERPRTKLVCTIGPASIDHVRELVDLGMAVARINFSHGTLDEQRAAVHAVRAAAHHARRSVSVMADLPGRKVRLGMLEGGAVELQAGASFVLRAPGASTPAEPAVLPAEPAAVPAPPVIVAPEQTAAADAEAATPADAEAATPADAEAAATAEPETAATAELATTVAVEPASVVSEAAMPADRASAEQAPSAEPGPPVAEAEPPAPVEPRAAEPEPAPGNAAAAEVDSATLAEQLQVGDRILLADGAAELRVTGINGKDVQTEVVHGGLVRSRAGVNVPSQRLTGPPLTAADEQGIAHALELRCDLIAQSFVRSADDVRALRERLPVDGPLVVAKIETRAAVDDFDAVCALSDGVMVARGDLGVDLPFAEVPIVQKDLLARARRAGRFAIVATQMLESMTAAPRPTRAEVSDVANAVLDGADGLMLSAETAIGAHPLEAARAMLEICHATEAAQPGVEAATAGTSGWPAAAEGAAAPAGEPAGQQAIVDGAVELLGRYPRLDAAWCFTRTGRTAALLATRRPRQPVVAFTISPVVARRLAMRYGVVPIVLSAQHVREPLFAQMAAAARAHGMHAGAGTVLLLTTSAQPSGINRLELQRIE